MYLVLRTGCFVELKWEGFQDKLGFNWLLHYFGEWNQMMCAIHCLEKGKRDFILWTKELWGLTGGLLGTAGH